MRRTLVVAGLIVGVLLPGGAADAYTPKCQFTPEGCYFKNNTIGSFADLYGQGANAKGTILLECSEDQMVRFTLTFAQDAVTGVGTATARCTGEQQEFKVTVPADGDHFVSGPASACATAVMINNEDVHREWCRAAPVTLG